MAGIALVEGTGAPVLVLHGWALDSSIWNDARSLTDTNRFTYAYHDFPGYGSNSASEPADGLDAMARAALDAAAELGWERFAVLGHSMGGTTAIRVATLAPEKVTSVVALTPVSPAGTPLDEATYESFRAAWPESGGLLSDLAPHLTEEQLQNILTASRATMDKAVWDRYLANWTQADFAAELGGYDAPTTLAVGASDPFVTADYLASTVSALRSGTLVTIDGAGHYPMVEQPASTVKTWEQALLIEKGRTIPMTHQTPYRGMPPQMWAPPAPQLIKNARMIIVGYKTDREALQEVLPPGLTPHENNLVQMNMYEVAADQTSGFGAFSLTYLTVEIDGHDSLAAEGTLPIPGRFFAYYWNSSPRVISYAREAAGIPAMHGVRRGETNGGTLTSTLSVEGRDVIVAEASVTDNALGVLGGHLNYYAHRQLPRPEGGAAAVSELIELPLPFTVDLYEATVDRISFDFPEGHPAGRLAPTEPLETPSVLYGDVTFTYSMGRRLVDYTQDGNEV